MASLACPVHSSLGVLERSGYVLLLLVALETPHGLDYIFLLGGCLLVPLKLSFDLRLQTALVKHVVELVSRTVKDDNIVLARIVATHSRGLLAFQGGLDDVAFAEITDVLPERQASAA